MEGSSYTRHHTYDRREKKGSTRLITDVLIENVK
ncbi:hypothetical protein Gorai_014329, partial [Gossypium raimondii]|nr:hypothetical protein [Gossypium raimondii]